MSFSNAHKCCFLPQGSLKTVFLNVSYDLLLPIPLDLHSLSFSLLLKYFISINPCSLNHNFKFSLQMFWYALVLICDLLLNIVGSGVIRKSSKNFYEAGVPRSKNNVLTLWKWHFLLICKFLNDNVETAFWKVRQTVGNCLPQKEAF